MVPSTLDLTDAVAALFEDDDRITFYVSIVEPAPPIDEYGVVKSYVVLYPTPGDASSHSLSGQTGPLLWGFHLTAGGGDHRYCTLAVDVIREKINGKTLTVGGIKVGLMQPPFGSTPPPVLTNLNVKPPRLSVPLEYRVMTVGDSDGGQ